MYNIANFSSEPFIFALRKFFAELNVPINYIDETPASAAVILGDKYNPNNPTYKLIGDIFVVGMVDNKAFARGSSEKNAEFNISTIHDINTDYDGILIFGVTIKKTTPTRTELADITRILNRVFPHTPVTVVFKYGNQIAFANTERTKYQQDWREGEKIGKVTMLRDIDTTKTNVAHLKILFGDRNTKGLSIDPSTVNSFKKIYRYWQTVFSLQSLNDQFYKDLQDWFYFAIRNIKLPFRPEYIDEKENIKNFLVRLLSRTLFCWFVKEKGLIKPELLELTNWEDNRYPLTKDIDEKTFLQNNSYYRGILQNVFYNALNQKDKKSIKDFKWTKYLHTNFKINWLTEIPYLNGGIFDKLDEDNAKESIEDSVIRIPNFLFYGIEIDDNVTKGKGSNAATKVEKVEHKGLNGILKSYKFTLDENTPFEEDIALDPEMLGLVFENLLAELDPNLEENTIKSIRKLTGSYYTPRKVIFEMVNDSLFLYLNKFVENDYPQIAEVRKTVSDLVYFNIVDTKNKLFCKAIVNGLDKFKMLDPACGSGAFPMGMLHRMVDLLKLVDPENELWIDLKLNNVDAAQRADFKKVLTTHLDDYGRKLGIIRDSIYGIDIQPLAVQITKLRFFISLLIDQNTEKGITPMPNIETKIICADTLKNIEADLFSFDTIDNLTEARTRYYQPDISHEERETIANEIVDILDIAFPSFAFQITGKNIFGQNKVLLKNWFMHSTLAAPFFNMDFFYPELKANGGFDCVIGNPPYGGVKISDEVRSTLKIESKDPYGAFIARFLNASETPTPLKHGGVLAYIVSDTFMTIKSHLPLRRLMMQNYVHKMLRVHPDTFRATVNTVIMVAERNTQKTLNANHFCLMADMTNISIHDNYDRFVEILNQTKINGSFSDRDDVHIGSTNVSTPQYAIYRYLQSLIKTNSNLPFFVASPKLFALMNDGNDAAYKPKTKIQEIGGKQVQVRTIEMNGKGIDVVKLGDIADVKQGLATGDNNSYLFQNSEARGNYRSIKDFKDFLLTDEDLKKIRNNERLRMSVIDNGICKDDPKNENYFGGKYIIPYDKGGESDADGGWMPNYYVPTDYFIDWSEWSVDRLKTLTTKDRNIKDGIDEGDDRLCSRFQNIDSFFIEAITFSPTGVYAPTFRIHLPSVYDKEGSCVFCNSFDIYYQIAIFSSKITKYFQKSVVNSTVHSMQGDIVEIIFPNQILNAKLKEKTIQLIQSQNSDPRYDYASHEQIDIDKLVYEAYGLTAEDVEEVENWYARRYTKLSEAQKQNLRNLCKSDDYLELYGMR